MKAPENLVFVFQSYSEVYADLFKFYSEKAALDSDNYLFLVSSLRPRFKSLHKWVSLSVSAEVASAYFSEERLLDLSLRLTNLEDASKFSFVDLVLAAFFYKTHQNAFEWMLPALKIDETFHKALKLSGHSSLVDLYAEKIEINKQKFKEAFLIEDSKINLRQKKA